MFSSQIVGHSVNDKGKEIATFLITFNRWILAEFNTHRMFSRNSASSRAIPFNKMVESVRNNPFVPIAWQIDHSGMQGNKYITDPELIAIEVQDWLDEKEQAVQAATFRHNRGVTKQICNRTLEPWMWHTAIVTMTDIENFFYQRCPKYVIGSNTFRSKKDVFAHYFDDPDYYAHLLEFTTLDWLSINKGAAEIHMMELAEHMWDSYNESIPETVLPGQWHLPFKDQIKEQFSSVLLGKSFWDKDVDGIPFVVKISSVMAARTSYTVVGTEMSDWTIEKYVQKCTDLIEADPIHGSPLEHCAIAMQGSDYTGAVRSPNGKFAGGHYGRCGNFEGFIQYRKMIDGENKVKSVSPKFLNDNNNSQTL